MMINLTKRFTVKDWRGQAHRLTAYSLVRRVLKDADNSDYGWIASASELVRVTSDRDFPLSARNTIRTAILRCFAQSALVTGRVAPLSPEDSEAVMTCFVTLPNDAATNNLRRYFLCQYARRAMKTFDYGYGPGAGILRKAADKWAEQKIVSLMVEFPVQILELDSLDQLKRMYEDELEAVVAKSADTPEYEKAVQEFEEEMHRECAKLLEDVSSLFVDPRSDERS